MKWSSIFWIPVEFKCFSNDFAPFKKPVFKFRKSIFGRITIRSVTFIVVVVLKKNLPFLKRILFWRWCLTPLRTLTSFFSTKKQQFIRGCILPITALHHTHLGRMQTDLIGFRVSRDQVNIEPVQHFQVQILGLSSHSSPRHVMCCTRNHLPKTARPAWHMVASGRSADKLPPMAVLVVPVDHSTRCISQSLIYQSVE